MDLNPIAEMSRDRLIQLMVGRAMDELFRIDDQITHEFEAGSHLRMLTTRTDLFDRDSLVLLGGTSLLGGRGGVIGTLGSVLLLGLTNNLLVVLKVNQWIQDLLEGLSIVGAVALYRQKGRQ